MKRLFIFLCFTAALRVQTSAVTELLNRVSERYRHMTTYVIDIERRNTGYAVVAGGGYPRGDANKIILARADTMLRFEVSFPGHRYWRITDGQQKWTYNG